MNFIRFFNTVRYLKPVQIYERFWFKLYRPTPVTADAPELNQINGKWTNSCTKQSSFRPPFRFEFLNVTQAIKSPDDWNNPNWDKLWLYNLHYFDDLLSQNGPF